jgi:predicted nucleotide-binding protein
MDLPSVDREITKVVAQSFMNLNLSTPRRELVVRFKPHGSDGVHRLVKCNVLRQLDSEELLPNAIAFHYCGDKDALDFAKTSVEIVIPVLQHLFETTHEGVVLTAAAVEATVKSFWADVKPEAVRLGLFLAHEMALLSGAAWIGNQTGAQAVRVNEKTVNIDASTAWDDHIRRYSKYVDQVYKEEAREKFLQGIFDLAEGREDRTVVPMQRNELASRMGITKEDHDSIVRELLAEDIIKQRPASEAISITRRGIEELRELRPFDSQEYVTMAVPTESRKIFLVHGHDEAVKQSVARFLEKLNLEVIILHEQPNKGRTVIEKFEQHSDVGFAVVLMTPDDIGGLASDLSKTQTRARQNVILELGYFFGKLGRERVCAVHTGGVELPSDIHGILYIPFDAGGGWRLTLAKEIKAAGIDVDLNHAVV